jgi:isocitrate lyase
LDEATIARFQLELAAMGYKFQFVTLAGFHALNLSMFELARVCKLAGMTAYSRLQEKEFSGEAQHGYEAVKHQRFVGIRYFDALTQVIAGGASSVTALAGSTEAEQFAEMTLQMRPQRGPDAARQPILGECPSVHTAQITPRHEEILLPSGD